MNLASRKQRGFVLAATLWMLAIVAIGAAYFAERVSKAADLVLQSRKNTEVLIDLANTRAEILFRIGTTSLSLYGLGTGPKDSIALDNRPYRGAGSSIVRLQDNRGLLNLNIVGDDRLYRFLGVLNVPAETRGRLIDTLRDYIDEDHLKRLNGAEDAEYAAQKLPPPRNELLSTPYEARSIIGWRNLPQLWEGDRLPNLTTISTSVALNPNTAPWEVLATLPGITNEIAQAMIARRSKEPFVNESQIAALSGGSSQQLIMQLIPLPSDSVRVIQSAPGLPWALQYNISLTPNSDQGPWRVDYHYKTKLPYRDDKIQEIPQLPRRTALPADLLAPF